MKLCLPVAVSTQLDCSYTLNHKHINLRYIVLSWLEEVGAAFLVWIGVGFWGSDASIAASFFLAAATYMLSIGFMHIHAAIKDYLVMT